MDLTRELDHIQRKGFDWMQKTVGEVVIWWEFDAVNTEYDNVYDEPSLVQKRAWKSPIVLPALWVNETEDDRRGDAGGTLVTNTIALAVPMRTLREAGLSSPMDHYRHLNDIFLYRASYWDVTSYQRRGRLRDDVIVRINGTSVRPNSDIPFDDLPTIDGFTYTPHDDGFPNDDSGGVGGEGGLDWEYPDDQTFPEHELPAHQEID